jgi:hypothetical protein
MTEVNISMKSYELHYNGQGTVGVTYYDFRNDISSVPVELSDHWFASSIQNQKRVLP